jgi:hypothetical protein
VTDAPAFAFKLELLDSAGSYVSTLATASYATPVTGWGLPGFRPISVQFGNLPNNTTVSANQRLRLSVSLTNGVPVVLAYGTTLFPSEMSLPYSSGQG